MTGRRTIVGLCMLCALAFSAFAAQSASAATLGTTQFTCKMVTPAPGTAGFSKEHCKAEDAVSTEATFEHFAVEQGLKTHITAINKNTDGTSITFRLKSTISGIETEISATGVDFTGFATNVLSGKEHIIEGSGHILFTGVKVTKPAEKGCVVKGEEVKTKPLVFTSAGQEMAQKFTPETGTTFAEFEIEGCSIAELNGKYESTGSIKSTSIDGATINYTHANTTAQNTLKLRGQKAGIEGTVTVTGAKIEEEPTVPLSVTTVSTE